MKNYKNQSKEGSKSFQQALKYFIDNHCIKTKDGYKTADSLHRRLYSFNELQRYFKQEYWNTLNKHLIKTYVK